MSHTPTPNAGQGQPTVYRIRFKGHLSPRWDGWFDCMTIIPEANGTTLLTGSIVDQAALHGLLTKIRDLGLTLISITRVEAGQDEPIDALNTNHRKDTA